MKLSRKTENKFGTFGELTLPSGDIIQTLELPWENNEPNVSRIPPGEYKCEIVQSPRFGRVYEIKSVPNRTHILIHKGNWIKDTNGCILLGQSKVNDGVSQSKIAFDKFMFEINGDPFIIQIEDI